MNNNKVIFYPPIQQRITLNKFTVSISDLVLFSSCTVCVILYDTEDKAYDNRIYKLDGQDYLNWNNDDKYIIDWVKAKLIQESSSQST